MYIPTHFEVTDLAKLAAVMHASSFATIVTDGDGGLYATHVPVLFLPERGPHGMLVGHFARANPHWRHFRPDKETLAVFQGPHGYVSPSWYKAKPAVPTWNYVAVHAYGFARLMEDERELDTLLRAMIEKYESPMPNPWKGNLPEDFKRKMMKAIVGFEIEVTRLEGKFKLSQNRSADDVAAVIQALMKSPNAADHELAAAMTREQPRSKPSIDNPE